MVRAEIKWQWTISNNNSSKMMTSKSLQALPAPSSPPPRCLRSHHRSLPHAHWNHHSVCSATFLSTLLSNLFHSSSSFKNPLSGHLCGFYNCSASLLPNFPRQSIIALSFSTVWKYEEQSTCKDQDNRSFWIHIIYPAHLWNEDKTIYNHVQEWGTLCRPLLFLSFLFYWFLQVCSRKV